MSIFITGATGYLGSNITALLLKKHDDKLILLIRSDSPEEAGKKLWKSLQLHMNFQEYSEFLNKRINIVTGDITWEKMGLDESYDTCVGSADSIIHCASILNRKSDKACFNVNLKGTLEVIAFAKAIAAHHHLKRFSYISTVNVAGIRQNEFVTEDTSIDWEREDYDPYSRTKKFCEHMISQLLPDTSVVVFRPSAIIGDSRMPHTTQFDMVRPFVTFSKSLVIPFNAQWKLDIVPVDFVALSVVAIHKKEKPKYSIYHVSAGLSSSNYREIAKAIKNRKLFSGVLFLPFLEKPFLWIINVLSKLPQWTGVKRLATQVKVFIPYITYNTVFDNARIVEETGMTPVSFTKYCRRLFAFSERNDFTYPYRPWPE
jgi:thioester reductase-like protein